MAGCLHRGLVMTLALGMAGPASGAPFRSRATANMAVDELLVNYQLLQAYSECLERCPPAMAAYQDEVTKKLQEWVKTWGEVKGFPPPRIVDGRVILSLQSDILFDSGKWEIKGDGEEVLKGLADKIKGNDVLRIRIEGHTDEEPRNGKKYPKDNYDLGYARAREVLEFLAGENVPRARLVVSSYGEYDPVNGAGLASQRRVEFAINPLLSLPPVPEVRGYQCNKMRMAARWLGEVTDQQIESEICPREFGVPETVTFIAHDEPWSRDFFLNIRLDCHGQKYDVVWGRPGGPRFWVDHVEKGDWRLETRRLRDLRRSRHRHRASQRAKGSLHTIVLSSDRP